MIKLRSIKSVMFSLVTLSIMAVSTSSLADDMVDQQRVNVDHLFKHAHLKRLIETSKARNLEAQTKDPDASTSNISDLTDFIAIGVIDPEGYTLITEFNKHQRIMEQAAYSESWLGVDNFLQKEIPNVTLQEGLDAVKTCMADKGDPLPEKISRVIIYKTINTSQIIYDYLFRDPNLYPGVCQEILYTPATGACEIGMKVYCHYDVKNPMPKYNKKQ